jgi:hypothetical protein
MVESRLWRCYDNHMQLRHSHHRTGALSHLYSVLSCWPTSSEALQVPHTCHADNWVSDILTGSRLIKAWSIRRLGLRVSSCMWVGAHLCQFHIDLIRSAVGRRDAMIFIYFKKCVIATGLLMSVCSLLLCCTTRMDQLILPVTSAWPL